MPHTTHHTTQLYSLSLTHTHTHAHTQHTTFPFNLPPVEYYTTKLGNTSRYPPASLVLSSVQYCTLSTTTTSLTTHLPPPPPPLVPTLSYSLSLPPPPPPPLLSLSVTSLSPLSLFLVLFYSNSTATPTILCLSLTVRVLSLPLPLSLSLPTTPHALFPRSLRHSPLNDPPSRTPYSTLSPLRVKPPSPGTPYFIRDISHSANPTFTDNSTSTSSTVTTNLPS